MFEDVSPDMARLLLTHNTNNRPQKPKSIDLYVRQMEANEFIVNGETIKFDTNGVLLDGQNRLIAISRQPQNFTHNTLIVRNLPPEAFKTIDIGSLRSASDLFQLAGHKKYSRLMPSILRKHNRIFVLQQGVTKTGMIQSVNLERGLTGSECIEIYELHKNLLDDIAVIVNAEASKVILSSATAGAILLYLIRDEGEDEATVYDYIEVLYTGAELSAGSSMLSTRNKLIKMQSRVVKFNELSIVKMVLKEYSQYKKRERQATK